MLNRWLRLRGWKSSSSGFHPGINSKTMPAKKFRAKRSYKSSLSSLIFFRHLSFLEVQPGVKLVTIWPKQSNFNLINFFNIRPGVMSESKCKNQVWSMTSFYNALKKPERLNKLIIFVVNVVSWGSSNSACKSRLRVQCFLITLLIKKKLNPISVANLDKKFTLEL